MQIHVVGIPFYHPQRRYCANIEIMTRDQAQPLDLDSCLQSLLLLLNTLVSLGTHDTTTPLSAGILRVGKVTILNGTDKLGKLALVLGSDLGDGEDGSSLKFYVN